MCKLDLNRYEKKKEEGAGATEGEDSERPKEIKTCEEKSEPEENPEKIETG